MMKKIYTLALFLRNAKNIKKSSKKGFLGGLKKGPFLGHFGAPYIRENVADLVPPWWGHVPGKIGQNRDFWRFLITWKFIATTCYIDDDTYDNK
jgi:hypothetical protein